MRITDFFDANNDLKWDLIESLPEFKRLKDTPQTPVWHKEGNVWNHTKLVVEEVLKNSEHLKNEEGIAYKVLVLSALFHDLGKATTTQFSKEKNDWISHNHGREGAKIARQLIYDEPDIFSREQIVYMVRHHMTLHHIFDNEDKTFRKMAELSYGLVPTSTMALLQSCDSLGSKNDIDTFDSILAHTHKVLMYACKEDCIERHRFPSSFDKLAFFYGDGLKLSSPINKTQDFTVYVMIGLPGSGKDTYIKDNLPKDIKVVCRDDIRTEMGLKGEKPMGNKEQENEVTRIANERIDFYCQNKVDFVVNQTNVVKKYRVDLLKRIMPYNPRIIYVYVEADSLAKNYERRESMMPVSVINRMLSQLEFPTATEYDELIISQN